MYQTCCDLFEKNDLQKRDQAFKKVYLGLALLFAVTGKIYHVLYKDVTIYYAEYWHWLWIAACLFSLVAVVPVYYDLRNRRVAEPEIETEIKSSGFEHLEQLDTEEVRVTEPSSV